MSPEEEVSLAQSSTVLPSSPEIEELATSTTASEQEHMCVLHRVSHTLCTLPITDDDSGVSNVISQGSYVVRVCWKMKYKRMESLEIIVIHSSESEREAGVTSGCKLQCGVVMGKGDVTIICE